MIRDLVNMTNTIIFTMSCNLKVNSLSQGILLYFSKQCINKLTYQKSLSVLVQFLYNTCIILSLFKGRAELFGLPIHSER